MIKEEVEVSAIRIEVAVRYEEEDIPNDFPLRDGEMWRATVEMNTGKIKDWPVGKSGRLQMKVCDEGTYTLLDAEGKTIASIEQDYIPNKVVPGEYGDYIDLKIDENGIVTNWFKEPDFRAFFNRDDE